MQALQDLKTSQEIGSDGRIVIRGHAKVIRYMFLSGLVVYLITGGYYSINLGDPFMIYSTIIPVHSLILLVIAWTIYTDPAKGTIGNELVSVVIPVYNQKCLLIKLILPSASTTHTISGIACARNLFCSILLDTSACAFLI